MNRRKRKQTYNKNTNDNKKIIRCKLKMIPVFEGDTCKDFAQKEHSESTKICKNCKNSF